MRATHLLVATVLFIGAAACSSSKSSPSKSAQASSKTMPDVTGKQLDVAEVAIKSAGGDPDKVKEVGGGKFGIVVKSNWQVCSQTPRAGAALPASPQLTVERSCATSPPASPSPASPPAASSGSSGSSGSTPLTVNTSPDLAALLKVGNNCAPSVQRFATKYAGREIEFDGSVADQAPHADPADIRHDILIGPGDKGVNSTAFGPSFQYQNVSDSDLHLTGSNSLKVGDKLHIVAEVGGFNGTSCNFQLIPISTAVR